ncbi:MAG: hypothetical protein WBC33_01245 [Conexibacter sp.]
MTENETVSSIASQWVAALTQRGVTLAARGKQLVMSPKSAYSAMTNEERATLKRHKPAIVALVKEGYADAVVVGSGPSVQVAAPVTSSAAPTSAPEPSFCAYCMRAPCAGRDHPAFATLHASDPEEERRRAEEATAEMHESMRRASGLRPTARYRDDDDEFSYLPPAERERELAAQRIRRAIGWELSSGIGTRRT